MDKVEISDDQITTIESIAPDLRGLKIAFVNVFAVVHGDGTWTLIDAGLPLSAKRIRSWIENVFGRGPNAIVLTHGHFDHVGAAAELAEVWDVPVYAHPLEFPYLTGQQEYPAPDWKAGGGAMPFMSPTLPRGPIDLGQRLKPLPGEGENLSLVEMPGWTLLHTPGHTPGHVSFFRKDDRTLLVGDAFCTTKAESFFDATLTQPAELHGPPSYFTSDWGAAKTSVRKLAGLQPRTVAPGHGRPLSGEHVASALEKLARDFERIAVPEDVREGKPGGDAHL